MKYNNVSNIISYCTFWLYGIVHPIEKKIVFNSFFGKQYSDNPRAICEKMHELYPDYELVWLLNNKGNELIPNYVRTVSPDDHFFAWGREIATAASYVYNIEHNTRMFKKKQQSFIQTWHGDRAIKKILKDINPKRVVYDNELTTLCVAGSKQGIQLYHSAFGYNGEILSTGCPRNDCLIYPADNKQKQIKEQIGIPVDSNVLLYAPTFRDNKKDALQESNVDIIKTLDAFPQNKKWVCLIRAHVASMGLTGNFDDERIVDVTKYPDMADILSITDMLISDYSSCATDFTVTGKPVILALFDKEEYQKNCRDFFAEPEKAGFIVVYNQEQLEQTIRNTSDEEYRKACDRVNQYYGTMETGHSADDVCHYIDSYYREHVGRRKSQKVK